MNPSLNSNGRDVPTFAGDRSHRLFAEELQKPVVGFDVRQMSAQVLSDQRAFDSGLKSPRGMNVPREHQLSRSFAAQSTLRMPSGIVDGFAKICDRWQLHQHDKAILLGFPDNLILVRSILDGDVLPFSRDMRDRMTHVVGISYGLGEMFDDDVDAELSWLRRRRRDLLDQAPLAYMLEGAMQNLLRVADLVLQARGF